MLQGTVAAPGTAAPAAVDTAAHAQGAPQRATTAFGALDPTVRHPADGAMSRTIRRDLYSLDPRRIVESGFYVRETDIADAEFAQFVEAIRARGEIDQPISVRTRVIGPQDRQYILVWGMRRLRAALALGLTHVPVRDFGDLDETGAIRLQLQENLNRKEMTPAETATAFWELHQRGVSGAEIARDNARTKGYVSALLNAGQVIAALTAEERRALNAPGRFRVRDAQALMAIKGAEARVDALRAMLSRPERAVLATVGASRRGAPDEDAADGRRTDATSAVAVTPAAEGEAVVPPPAPPLGRSRRVDEDEPFHVRPIRGGRGRVMRIRWHDDDLRAAPQAFVARLATFLQQEVDHLHARLATLETASPPSATSAADLDAAKRQALKLASWLREEGNAAG